MPSRRIIVQHDVPDAIADGLANLRDTLGLGEDFPDEVIAEAEQVARDGYDHTREYRDLTDLAFETIDPPSSMDLDQAMFLQRRDAGGFKVWYAIADVAAWVRPGGAIDLEANRRGQTFYAPNLRYPLHPPQLSEGAASLLADGTPRPALVWQIELDAAGAVQSSTVERALVVSRAKLNYTDVQVAIDNHTASASVMLLKEIGEVRQQGEIERGGVSLDLSEQEVVVEGDQWALRYREALPDEGWNAQISLLTGIVAGEMMVKAGVGILRTLPPPTDQTISQLRRIADALRLDWPREWTYARFVRSLDTTRPDDQAMTMACIRLFRGAGYTVIEDGQSDDQRVHGALATIYAHTTAPLRRLVDRYVGEICLALCANQPVPQWVLDALPGLPDTMSASDKKAKAFERGVVDLVEALLLNDRVGQTFNGVVIMVDQKQKNQATVAIPEPAVTAPIHGHVALGDEVRATVESVDVARGKVRFVTA